MCRLISVPVPSGVVSSGPREYPAPAARHGGPLERLPGFARVRSGVPAHPYVGEREESLLPETYLDPHMFRVPWEECARSEAQVALQR